MSLNAGHQAPQGSGSRCVTGRADPSASDWSARATDRRHPTTALTPTSDNSTDQSPILCDASRFESDASSSIIGMDSSDVSARSFPRKDHRILPNSSDGQSATCPSHRYRVRRSAAHGVDRARRHTRDLPVADGSARNLTRQDGDARGRCRVTAKLKMRLGPTVGSQGN